jgi:hypothetical protein
MTVPARREAARLLLSLDPPAWALRHACAVADTASWLARAISVRGTPVDVRAVEAAALLHDADKLPGGARGGLRHGDGSAAWLSDSGLGELAPLVRDHPVTRLADDADHARLADAALEARIVAYADKRAGQRLEPMADRFASWRRRYPSGPADPSPAEEPVAPGYTSGDASGVRAGVPPRDASTHDDRPPTGRGWAGETSARVEARALELEREICRLAGVEPDAVRRNRWARRALREAAR